MSAKETAPEMEIETVTKTIVPSWSKRMPKRTIVLAIVSVLAVVLYFVFASIVASATSPGAGLFAAWRLNIVNVIVLWVAVVSGLTSVLSWLMHVQSKENQQREIAYARSAAAQTPKRPAAPQTPQH